MRWNRHLVQLFKLPGGLGGNDQPWHSKIPKDFCGAFDFI
jgi:hypothetical protein